MPISFETYRIIFFTWIGIAIVVFILLQKIVAPYGRHNNNNLGPQIPNHIGWLLMELPALLIMMYFFFKSFNDGNKIIAMMIGLYCFHYFNRSLVFPFRLHTKGKKMPLLIVFSAIFFNLCNTILLGYYFSHFANYASTWLTDIRFISGLLIFITGIYINWKADDILIHLRKPGETNYLIPQGWLFNMVSCPNLLGELIEWAGFALLCWNMPALAFFIWTFANLVPRAMAHHRWYKQYFTDYPKSRKAILPFVY